MAKTIAIANQKGGVGKTTSCMNLGTALATQGRKILLVDADAQGNLTSALGIERPDALCQSLADLLLQAINGEEPDVGAVIHHHVEGVDFIPANIMLASLERTLNDAMARETLLRRILGMIKDRYDYILIDCQPALGGLTVNALVAADSVLIPVQAHFFSVQGLQELFKTIGIARRTLNPGLAIEGVLFTFIQKTRFNQEIVTAVKESYGEQIPIFMNMIPQSIRAAESTAEGHSIFMHDPKGRIAEAYRQVAEEVLSHG